MAHSAGLEVVENESSIFPARNRRQTENTRNWSRYFHRSLRMERVFFSEISKTDQGLIRISKIITKSAHNCYLIYDNNFKNIKLLHASDLTSPSRGSAFLLGDSPAYELYVSSCLQHLWRWNWQSVPKRRHIKFRDLGIIQIKSTTLRTGRKFEIKNNNCRYIK